MTTFVSDWWCPKHRMLVLEKREKPEFAEKYGLEFDEDKHRWVHPKSGEEYQHKTGKVLLTGKDYISDQDTWELEKKIKDHPTYVNIRESMALQFYVGNERSWDLKCGIS